MAQEKKEFVLVDPRPKNYNVVPQSNLVLMSKNNLTLYEKRVLFNIIKVAKDFREKNQCKISNKRIQLSAEFKTDFILTIDNLLSPEEQKDYNNNRKFELLRTTVASLMHRIVHATITKANGEPYNVFTHIVSSVEEKLKFDGRVIFHVTPVFFQLLMDYEKGYTQLEMNTLFRLRSVHSMRFYELLCQWKNSQRRILIPIEKLRDFMQCNEHKTDGQVICTEKYPLYGDFKKRVIESAKKELDKKSPLTFTYEEVKDGRKIGYIIINIIDNPTFKQFDFPELPFET